MSAGFKLIYLLIIESVIILELQVYLIKNGTYVYHQIAALPPQIKDNYW